MANGATYPRKWEILSENTERLRVPGGWLVKDSIFIMIKGELVTAAQSLLFLPDPDYAWSLE